MRSDVRKEIPFHIPSIDDDDINSVLDVLRSKWITMGSKTAEFEELFADYIGCKHAIAVNSGTAALHLCLDVIGITNGDEIIIPTNTFTATAEVCLYNNATPKFVDIDEKSYNINPDLIQASINEKTKAIIPVHVAGYPCDMDKIDEIGEKHNLHVIEDAAHSIETFYKNKKIGNISELTAFSFYSTKNLTTGEGGMITTNNDDFAEKLDVLRLHGMSRDAWKRYQRGGSWYYEILEKGYKYNTCDILSALGVQQLKKIRHLHEKRKYIFEKYNVAFKSLEEIVIPKVEDRNIHGYHLYILRLRSEFLDINRNQFVENMKNFGIECSVHFIPLHLQPFYQKKFGYKKGDFPVAEKVFKEVISLPLYPDLIDQNVDYIIESVKNIIGENKKRKSF